MNKRELGQYYTVNNPFTYPLFKKWMCESYDGDTILEPFAGSNNIPRLINESGYKCVWKCFDIDPSNMNTYPEYVVEQRDTISNFPDGYDVCITNCPYLGKSSAGRRKIDYPWTEDDLYKVCLNIILNSCEYAAVIIPESFITSRIYRDRLWGVISLTCKMFMDTECPVCLALFAPYKKDNVEIYSNDIYLGNLNELEDMDFKDIRYNVWKFNDPFGSIGVKTIDNQMCDDCRFFNGNEINPELIKVSSRSFTRISGLPDNIDVHKFISLCNESLFEYRQKTKDVLMTSFKGLRTDGKYRRRLDFRTVRCIMDNVLKNMNESDEFSLF